MAKSRGITEPGTYNLYTPYRMKGMSAKAIRSEYSRLRSIANKRLSRLQSQNIGMKAREGFRFPSIKEIEQNYHGDVGSALADVSHWLADPRSSVTGEKKFLKEFKEMFESKKYGDLVQTTEQIYNTIRFLEEVRSDHSDQLLPSGDALDALQQAERLKIPTEKLLSKIELFTAHLEELEKIEPTKGGRKFSSTRFNALVRKWE